MRNIRNNYVHTRFLHKSYKKMTKWRYIKKKKSNSKTRTILCFVGISAEVSPDNNNNIFSLKKAPPKANSSSTLKSNEKEIFDNIPDPTIYETLSRIPISQLSTDLKELKAGWAIFNKAFDFHVPLEDFVA